jgi:prepilin-type N-terminal cleavage/methylation domain-containing protein
VGAGADVKEVRMHPAVSGRLGPWRGPGAARRACCATRGEDERGFTLVELIIAMMVLAIVMAALAPAFYGELKATAATDYRSTATGLAVAAIEQMRAFPYSEIGWDTSDYETPSTTATVPSSQTGTCIGSGNTNVSSDSKIVANEKAPSWNVYGATYNPVELNSGSAFDLTTSNLYGQETIGPTTYDIARCVYWVAASPTSSGTATYPSAYKLTWVGVSWKVSAMSWHVTQASAVYPGGAGTYTAENNDSSTSTTCQNTGGGQPSAPNNLTASVDTTQSTTTADLAWTAPTTYTSSELPLTYEVEYKSSATGAWTVFSQNSGLLSQDVDGLSPGTEYWFQVLAVACDGSALTTGATTTYTTPSASQACTAESFTVTPSSTTIGSNDKLDQISSFQASATVTSSCNNVALYYSPTNNSTYTTDSAPAGSGTLTWNTSATKWAVGTITFHLYIGGTDSGETAQVKIACDAQHC